MYRLQCTAQEFSLCAKVSSMLQMYTLIRVFRVKKKPFVVALWTESSFSVSGERSSFVVVAYLSTSWIVSFFCSELSKASANSRCLPSLSACIQDLSGHSQQWKANLQRSNMYRFSVPNSFCQRRITLAWFCHLYCSHLSISMHQSQAKHLPPQALAMYQAWNTPFPSKETLLEANLTIGILLEAFLERQHNMWLVCRLVHNLGCEIHNPFSWILIWSSSIQGATAAMKGLLKIAQGCLTCKAQELM